MEIRVGGLKFPLRPGGMLWAKYPEGTAKPGTDVNRERAASRGLRTVALFSVDDAWAALRLKAV
jgi:hypothetical protein